MVDKRCKKLIKRPLTYGAKGVAVVFGHQTCSLRTKFPYVPREMGWLWTSRDVPGLQFRPDWRPGAVRRSVYKLISHTSQNLNTDISTSRSKKRLIKSNAKGDDEEHDEDEKVKPTFVIRNVDGDYIVTLQQLKDPKTRLVTDYPYTDDPPYNFKVLNMTPEEMKRLLAKREKTKKCMEDMFFQEAFDNICKEIYKNIDKDELCKIAAQKETCLCQALQSEILCNFAESLGEIPPEVCPEEKKSSSSLAHENWSVEFTPPIAKFDPNRKIRNRFNKSTQFEVRGNQDDDDDKNKKGQPSLSFVSADLGEVEEIDDGLDDVCVTDGGTVGDTEKVKKKKKKKKKEEKKEEVDDGKNKGGGAGNFMKDLPEEECDNVCPPVDPCCNVCPVTYCSDDPCCYSYYNNTY